MAFPLGSGLYDENGTPGNFALGSGLYGQAPLPIVDGGVPPAAASQSQQQPFDMNALLMNPALQMGLNLIGNARNPYGWSTALQNTLQNQFQTQAGQRANKKLALEEAKNQAEIPLMQAQTSNLGAETQLHGAQAQLALRKQAQLEALAKYFGGGASAGAPPMDSSSGGGMPEGAAGNGGGVGQIPPALSQAMQLDLMTNEGKGLPGLMAKVGEPVAGANGVMYTRGPNGLQVDPQSMQAFQAQEAYKRGLENASGFIEVPQPGGGSKMMRKDVAIAQAGGNPGGIAATNLANNNFGNIRPAGQSQGFAAYSTPEAGLKAIDDNLAAYGSKHGINTVEGVVNRWLGGGADGDNVKATINSIAQMSGFKLGDKIDLGNPATRQILGSAIMRNEHGQQAFMAPQAAQAGAGTAEPGVVGRTPTLAEKSSMEAAGAQQKQISESWGKQYDDARVASGSAAEKKASAQLLMNYLDGVKTGTFAPTTLAVNKFAASMGFKIPENTPNVEAAKALGQQMIFELRDPKQGGGLPGSMSNWEDKLLLSMIPGIDKLPGTNKILANAYIKKQERIQGIAQTMAQYRKEHGVLDDGVQDAIAKYRDDHPLFTPDERSTIENALQPKQDSGMTRISPREVTGKITGPGYDAARGTGSRSPDGVKFLGFE